jgi:uncharacterized DUF497 family protein
LGTRFEWDQSKAARKKHGVSFHEAGTVFGDPAAGTIQDRERSERETRYVTIGRSSRGRILAVVHTDRMGRIRIISARRVTRQERQRYEEA